MIIDPNVITEAVVVGLMLIMIGIPISILPFFGVNPDFQLVLFLFIVGTLTHLFFEIAGLNTLYCKKGVACKKIQ